MVLKRALISTANKTHLKELSESLVAHQVEIIASDGTAAYLKKYHIPVTTVSEYTGFPEMMGGRVKTLHPKIHGGLLGRRGIDDEEMKKNGILPIDLVILNLYPFQDTIAKPNCTLEEAISMIDIGGPTLLRAAAKNYADVTVVTDPSDYDQIIEELNQSQNTQPATRAALAKKAFRLIADYDRAISQYLQTTASTCTNDALPTELSIQAHQIQALRYGENPHQQAAVYTTNQHPSGLAQTQPLQGKALSYNNLLDADTAWQAACSFQGATPTCVIVKHATPCGIAQDSSQTQAYQKAYQADSSSAFGGILAFNTELTEDTAQAIISQQFAEVILAPAIAPAALAVLSKKPNIRVLVLSISDTDLSPRIHSIDGGFLAQTPDADQDDPSQWPVVTHVSPTPEQQDDLLFAWRVSQIVKSNAIVYAHQGITCGLGTGQTSRVFSAEIAILKARQNNQTLSGAVMASDAFLPFPDTLDMAHEAGITACIQPGGSIRDDTVIQRANELNMAMIFTSKRHFRH